MYVVAHIYPIGYDHQLCFNNVIEIKLQRAVQEKFSSSIQTHSIDVVRFKLH